MNANMAKTQPLIENVFTSAVEELAKDKSDNFMNDLYVQANAESGELQIYDNEEYLVEKIVILDWANLSEEGNVFNKWIATSVKVVLMILSIKNIFDVPRFMKPLSVSLTDEDSVVIEELLFIDDNILRLGDPILKDLDVDLGDFLASLLADTK